jgi:hypothetical protein
MLLEASIDLDRVPEEYVISASYDPKLQVRRRERAAGRRPRSSDDLGG